MLCSFFFFFNDTATTEIYTLSLHDALPILPLDDILLEAEEKMLKTEEVVQREFAGVRTGKASPGLVEARSEEHTSELQSLAYLVCRLLLEKKKKKVV